MPKTVGSRDAATAPTDAAQPTPAAQADWVQFNPWQVQGQAPQEPKRVNTITLFCLARKIIAREWRRARGIRQHDPRLAELEGCAREYQTRKIAAEEEERRQATRLQEEQERILECLDRFVDSMLDGRERKRITSLEQVGDLLAGAFGSLGEVLDVEWTEDGGCAIWLEPWPDRRARRRKRDRRPALRRLALDARLDISAYEPVTDPAVRQAKREDLLLRPLRLSEQETRRLRTPERTRDVLAERAWEVGRVLDIASENGSCKIRIQPWHEVRRHKLSKSRKEPISEYEITVSKDFQDLSCKRLED